MRYLIRSIKYLVYVVLIFFEMRAAVDIPKDVFIRSGYSANAEIILEQAENVLTIPESCVEYVGDSTFVYKEMKGDKKNPYKKQVVKVGLSDGIGTLYSQNRNG